MGRYRNYKGRNQSLAYSAIAAGIAVLVFWAFKAGHFDNIRAAFGV